MPTAFKRLLLLLSLLLLAGCARPAAALEFVTLARGHHSGIKEPTAVLITDQKGWEGHWRRHASIFVPPPPPPPVDFRTASVVALHLGERRTGGYSVIITAVKRADGALHVVAAERSPAPGSPVTMALTQPYHIIRVERVKPGTRLQVELGG
ncbi:MAG: protease complex subunit PrcB family protein [Bacillota bacterium]